MNTKTRLKASFIKRSLNKRRSVNPFNADIAEHFSLPSDADDNQNNSYYFSGHDASGRSLLFRYAQRGLSTTEIWFAFRDTNGAAYINKQQLFVGSAATGVKCIKTGREWEFFWEGELLELSYGKRVDANFKGRFSANGDIFEFGHDIDAGVMARAIARQKWSKAFFSELQENDQIHYEQPGVITGVLSIDGKAIDVSYPAVRDHSFGKRDWKYMNRHFWLMALFEDGGCLNVNMVSYPVLRLQTGYFIKGSERVCIESAEIAQEAVPNTVPDSFTCKAKLQDGRVIEVTCAKETEFVFPMGGYTIYEGVGAFELNGIKGRGVLEFGWNDDASRSM